MAITRSKQGCFTCRARRKKCNEVQPICLGCTRNFLKCEWPQYENQTLLQFRATKGKSIISSNGPSPPDFSWILSNLTDLGIESENGAYMDLIMGSFFGALIPEPTRTKAKEHFLQQHKTSLPLKKIAECIGTLLLSGNSDFQEQLYEDTLHTLRQAFGNSSDDILEDWALNTIALLTLREFSLDTPRLSELIKHLQASFHAIATRICRNQMSFWLRLTADSYTFYSGMVILCCGPAQISHIPNPLEVEKIWEPLFEDDEGRHDYETNPILSDLYVPFMLINQASYLLRSEHSRKEKLSLVLLRKVDKYITSTGRPLSVVMYCCCKIILLKALYPEMLNRDHLVRTTNEKLLDELHRVPKTELAMFGSLPIVLSAICSYSQKNKASVNKLCFGNGGAVFTIDRDKNFELALRSIWTDEQGFQALDDISLLRILLLNT